MARLKKDPLHRVVMHSHPTYTLAMTYVHELSDKAFTHSLWEMCTECIVVFPDGIGVLPWMLCGTNEIGRRHGEKDGGVPPGRMEHARHFTARAERWTRRSG